MWNEINGHVLGLPHGSTTPAPDPNAVAVTFTQAGATLMATLVFFTLLSFFGDRLAAVVWVKYIVLALGIGSWVVTNRYVLGIGNGLRKGFDKMIQASGHSDVASGGTFTILAILALAVGIVMYRKRKARGQNAGGWMLVVLAISAIFFTASAARDAALWYSMNVGVPAAKAIFSIF